MPLRRRLGVLFAAEVAATAWFSTAGGVGQARVEAWLSVDDVAMHALAFGVAAFTGFLAFAPTATVGGLLALMAVAVELVQAALPGREAALANAVASISGVGVAAAAVLLWRGSSA